jgi:GNAT superfamily N-acetyltransferase
MTSDKTFELASENDAERVCELVNSAYRGDSGRLGWTAESDYLDGQRIDPEMFRELFTIDSVVLVFPNGETPIGCVNIQRNGSEMYMGMVTVSPKMQSQGLGSFVMKSAEEWGKEHWGVKTVKITVISKRKELINWYIKRGFVPNGAVEPFPYGQERFGIPQMDDLEFIVLIKQL